MSENAWYGVRVAIVIALAWFFVAGATEHARTVNTSKARGDQSGYLWDAEQVYANWHGQTPPRLIGQRMRMPLYAGLLALVYTPRLTDPQFFEVARRWNIRLALVLVAALGVLLARHLPALAAANVTLVVAFGCFVFKAGYAQPELLFYFLFFASFLTCWRLWFSRHAAGSLALGSLAGTLAGLAYLTKALIPPFLALFLAVYSGRALAEWVRAERRGTHAAAAARRRLAWRAGAGVAVGVAFLAVVSPYILTSKRVFGAYFFNANTTYFMWYDRGAIARGIILPRTDADGRIAIPAAQLTTARAYWRTHSLAQVAAREAAGLRWLLEDSYKWYWYLKFVVLYLGACLVALAAAGRQHAAAMARDHAALLVFLSLYGAVYLAGTAFFAPTSETGGMRFLLAHVAPLLFVCAHVLSNSRLRDVSLSVGGVPLTPTHFQYLVLVTMASDLAFTIWPRLMTSYGGY